MKVRLLYSADCPSHGEALERLRKVLSEEAVNAPVDITRIETPEEAQREHYTGSPTILINGRDISPVESTNYAPACRAYLLEDGRISPLPSIAMIRRAIREAKKGLEVA